MQGAHPKAIQDHLRHKDIQTTFNVYGPLLPSVHDALTASLDAAYEGSGGENPSAFRLEPPKDDRRAA